MRFFGGTSNTVANNVISGNVNEGIFFHGDLGASHEMVLDNLIGTNAAGTAPIGNGLSGITLQQSAANTIDGNVISGNGVGPSGGNGITLAGASKNAVLGNLVQGNKIGTNAAGTAALGNALDGISLNDASSNRIIGNVVSGNGINQDAAGINLESNDRNNIIAGNKIGTNAAGNAALGNSLHGIFIGNGSSNNTIGGTTVNDRNVISGNGKFPVADLRHPGGRGGLHLRCEHVGQHRAGQLHRHQRRRHRRAGQLGHRGADQPVPRNTMQDNVISGNRLVGLEIAGGTAAAIWFRATRSARMPEEPRRSRIGLTVSSSTTRPITRSVVRQRVQATGSPATGSSASSFSARSPVGTLFRATHFPGSTPQ